MSTVSLAEIRTQLATRNLLVLIALLVLTVCAALWSLGVGPVAIPVQVIINTIFNLDGEQQTYIIMRSRVPRILMAILAGGALGLSGAIIQAVVRNPLASPNIIGINSGAALFALSLPDVPETYLPLAACLGGVLAAGFVIVVAHRRRLSAIHLALIGVAVGFVFESGVDYLLVVNTDRETSAAMMWLTGSLVGRTWSHVLLSYLPLIGLGTIALLLSYRLDLIALGEETATGLGLHVPHQRILLLLTATLLASVAVAFVGVMGFIGIMAPHIARRLVGGSHRLLLPVAMLVGMLLVVLADGVGRAVAPPIEISAGILTALIGTPFFVYIMLTTASEQGPMSIVISGVTAGYERDRPIIRDIDLEIRTGEVTVLIGPTGCGKSTLLKSIGRLLKPQAGNIHVDEIDILRHDPKRVARTIAYLPQSPIVPTAITVERLVGYGRAPHKSLLGLRSAKDIEVVDHAISITGLEDLRLKPLSELSGGQRQRAFIAMALAQDTPYVMLDEPTTFLDIRHQVETLELVRQLHDAGRTAIIVLHDIAQAARYGDRLVVMHDGRIVAEGAPEEVITIGMVEEVYGLKSVIGTDPISRTPVVFPKAL